MTDPHIYERLMSRILGFGVAFSSLLMAVGLLVASLQSTAVPMPDHNPTLGELLRRILSGQWTDMTASSATTIMFTGLVLLMLTPFLRVLTTLVLFWRERDWRFTALASAVLLMLAGQVVYSLL